MSISRTTRLGVLCSTLAITVIGSASPATAKPLWCEPAAPYGCSRWHVVTEEPTERSSGDSPIGMTTGQYLKLLEIRTL